TDGRPPATRGPWSGLQRNGEEQGRAVGAACEGEFAAELVDSFADRLGPAEGRPVRHPAAVVGDRHVQRALLVPQGDNDLLRLPVADGVGHRLACQLTQLMTE